MNSRMISWALFFNRGGMSPFTWNDNVHSRPKSRSHCSDSETVDPVTYLPWLFVAYSVWSGCRPSAFHTASAGTQWAAGYTDAPEPSSAWPHHAGHALPAPRTWPGVDAFISVFVEIQQLQTSFMCSFKVPLTQSEFWSSSRSLTGSFMSPSIRRRFWNTHAHSWISRPIWQNVVS